MWNEVRVMDGGMGTELERCGAEQVNSHQLWSAIANVNQPEIVLRAHRNFIDAGAQVIVANSYQANVPLFVEALSMSVEDARKATHDPIVYAKQAVSESGKDVLVAGSIGPLIDKPGSEYNPEYLKRLSVAELMSWHEPRFQILAQSECDVLALETIPGIREIEALFKLLEKYPKPAYLSMACCKNGEGRLNSGETWEDAFEFVRENKPESLKGIGINCAKPIFISDFGKLAKEMVPDLTLITYPNSGEDWCTAETWNDVEGQWCGQRQNTADFIEEWLEIGFRWIGGCCRVTPDEIRQISAKVKTNTK